MDLATLEDRLAKVLAGGASPMQDELLAPLIRASPLLFAQLCIKGPDVAPFYGRLLFSRAQYEWEDILTQEKRYCILASRGSGKTTTCTIIHALWRCATQPDSSGYIFSGTEFAAQRILEEIKLEIERNEKLRWLFPGPTSRKWTATQIRTSNGHSLVAKGMLTRIRGAHPQTLYLDDVATDEDAWSQAKRKKTIDYFYSTLTNMVMPGGRIGVVGCVHPDTYIGCKGRGVITIGQMFPKDSRRRQLHSTKHKIMGKDGFRQAEYLWDNGRGKAVHVTLKGGYELKCTRRHPVWYMNPETGEPEWRPAGDLQVGDYVALRKGSQVFGPDVDLKPAHYNNLIKARALKKKLTNVMNLPEYVNEELAYFLGLYIAEGHVSEKGQINIAGKDPCVQSFLLNQKLGLKFKSAKYFCQAGSVHLVKLLRHLGLPIENHAPKKRIPPKLLAAPKNIVVKMLQGMFDGDGSIILDNKGRLRVAYYTTSESIAFDLQQILVNLGMMSRRYSRPPVQNHMVAGKKDVWYVTMAGLDAQVFVRVVGSSLKRKKQKYAHLTGASKQDGDVNLIPHQTVLAKKVWKEFLMRRVGDHELSLLDDNMNSLAKKEKMYLARAIGQPSMMSVGYLTKMLRALKMDKDPCVWSSRLAENLREDLAWRQVEKIGSTHCNTYDFVIPDGHSFLANSIVSHNTPIHSDDLLGDLKRNPAYKNYRYPAEDEHGNSNWPEVYTPKFLSDLKKEIGSVRYARERLCEPVSDESSLFPRSLFYQQDMMMPLSKLGEQASYWCAMGVMNFYIGVDFALSTSAAADFWVLIVVGVDESGNRWIIDINRGRGLSFSEQKARIVSYGRKYDPVAITLEANAYQAVAANELRRQTDLPIKSFTTTAKKHSLTDGLPSLRILLENGKFRFPRGDARSVEMTDILVEEANNFTWVEGKAQSIGGHDDVLMSLYICEQAIRKGQRSGRLMASSSTASTSAPEPVFSGLHAAVARRGGISPEPTTSAPQPSRQLMPQVNPSLAHQIGQGSRTELRNGVYVRVDG